jgi:putative tricarboxylic transport membrane protein
VVRAAPGPVAGSEEEESVKRTWQVMCLLFFALSICVLLFSMGEPYKDDLGFGPAFFPVWMSIVTGVSSLALFAQTTWGRSAVDNSGTLLPDRQGIRRIMIILVSLAGCVALLDILGFRLSIFLFLLFLPPLLGANNWWGSLIFAVCGSVGVFYSFSAWLNVLLPVGIFGI